MIKYIADTEHYTEVLSRCEKVKHDLWIGTADLKDLYVEGGRDVVPFLSILDKLLKRGVDVRLLHAKEPGDNFREDFDKYPGLWSRLERRLCPRVHFKISAAVMPLWWARILRKAASWRIPGCGICGWTNPE